MGYQYILRITNILSVRVLLNNTITKRDDIIVYNNIIRATICSVQHNKYTYVNREKWETSETVVKKKHDPLIKTNNLATEWVLNKASDEKKKKGAVSKGVSITQSFVHLIRYIYCICRIQLCRKTHSQAWRCYSLITMLRYATSTSKSINK